MDSETLKILVVVLCFIAFGIWGVWVALRADERREAAKRKESGAHHRM